MSSISGMASPAYAVTALPASARPALGKGPKAAREFEAQLIGTVLESMQKSFASLPGQDSMAGQDELSYLGSRALATALAAGGGFGIAHMIESHLSESHPSSSHLSDSHPR
jgi:Rod binding domain-containing protein